MLMSFIKQGFCYSVLFITLIYLIIHHPFHLANPQANPQANHNSQLAAESFSYFVLRFLSWIITL